MCNLWPLPIYILHILHVVVLQAHLGGLEPMGSHCYVDRVSNTLYHIILYLHHISPSSISRSKSTFPHQILTCPPHI